MNLVQNITFWTKFTKMIPILITLFEQEYLI